MIICNGQCIVFSFFQSLSNSLAKTKIKEHLLVTYSTNIVKAFIPMPKKFGLIPCQRKKHTQNFNKLGFKNWLKKNIPHFKPLFILDSLHPSLYETISNGAACIQDAQKRTIKTVITANNELRLEHMLDD